MPGNSINRRHFGKLAISAALLPTALTAQTRLSVAAVNYPLVYFAERIAGDIADVAFPVPAGVDPSFWRPGIADIATFQAADVILLNGADFADWTARTTLPRSRLVNTSQGFEAAYIATETVTHSHGDGGEHSHTGTASYTWLDFSQASQQAEAVAAALSRAAPDAADLVSANLEALSADLAALHEAGQAIGESAQGISLIASHPRYQYFARAYGLSMEAVDWDAVEPPREDQWQSLADLVGEVGARVFIWEATPSAEAISRIEALGLTNVVFPPLANRPETGDFLSAMQASLTALNQAVEGVVGG